ncbi:unnamed protein product [Leptosia nina]|uniref:ditrans,polycis-polyprenyl diphosphate synthase [(2E,6E)-farnesyldiphosphate specific] n=1 Tax=Leptosia nina TaxID=320188 RepID=A0AAV1K0W7_9NEOP
MCNSPQYDSIITEVVSVREHVSSITKELRHLVVLVDTDQHSLNELARMIIWSLVFGISHISFYDITGELQKKEDKLFFEVEKQKKGIPGCIKWSKMPNLNGYTNGIHANTIFVNILSYNDGRPKLTKCIQEISRNTMLCEKSLDEYTSQELDWTFKSKYPLIPDPNLVLYTGPLCCTYGLLPWHIRFGK